MVNRLTGKSVLLLLALGALAPLAQAADAPTLNTGSTAWMITAAVLVLFMCLPGLALFYGGLVRAKNMLSLFTQCFGVAGLVGVLWVIYGYSMVVDTTGMVEGQVTFNSFVGGLSRAFLAISFNAVATALVLDLAPMTLITSAKSPSSMCMVIFMMPSWYGTHAILVILRE